MASPLVQKKRRTAACNAAALEMARWKNDLYYLTSPPQQEMTLSFFCTSGDAMCAGCTGHLSKGGDSASYRGERTKKQTKQQNRTKQQPNTEKETPKQQTAEYRTVRE